MQCDGHSWKAVWYSAMCVAGRQCGTVRWAGLRDSLVQCDGNACGAIWCAKGVPARQSGATVHCDGHRLRLELEQQGSCDGWVVRQCGAVRRVWCSGDAGVDTGSVRVATLWQAVVQSSSGVDVSRRLMSDAM